MKTRTFLVLMSAGAVFLVAGSLRIEAGPALDVKSPQVRIESRFIEADRNTALLLSVNWTEGALFDEVRLKAGTEWVKDVSGSHLPAGWESSPNGDTLDLHGPALQTPAYFRLDSFTKPPDSLMLDLMLKGASIFSEKKARVLSKPAVVTQTDLASVIRLPEYVLPADLITFKPLDPTETPVAGTWTMGGIPARYVPEAGHYEFRLPETWTGGGLSVTYVDPFGFKLYESPGSVDLKVEPKVSDSGTILLDVTPMVLAGDVVCATGYFPDWKSRSGILLNGAPVPDVYSSSSLGLVLGLGQDISPGKHTLGCDPASGFGTAANLPFTVIDVSGDVDRSKLLRGESTPLRLHVVGTAEPVELELVNLTPDIVSLSGGDRQVIKTSGGAQNDALRSVKGLKRGDFNLRYTLTLDPWPAFRPPSR